MRSMLVLSLLLAACAEKAAAPAQSGPRFRVVDVSALNACSEGEAKSAAAQSDVILKYAAAARQARSGDDAASMDAVRTMEQLARENAWFAQTHYGLGVAYGLREAWLPAYAAYKRYLHFQVHAADRERVRSELARMEAKAPALRQYADAERAAQQSAWADAGKRAQLVVEDQPTFALGHRLLAITHAANGRPADAVLAYEAYLQYDPLAVDRAEVEQIIAGTRAALGTVK
ncbi:MAG: hypothetical protein IT381_27175 [Deltaproteobacteria bacterium]|nr:hypothetical protein [Deltaproteobacteria bacterium]